MDEKTGKNARFFDFDIPKYALKVFKIEIRVCLFKLVRQNIRGKAGKIHIASVHFCSVFFG